MAGRELIKRAEKIRLVLMDVDGVWTDGTLYYAPDGGEVAEFKGVNAQDGMGLRWAHAAGIKTGLISGRSAPGITHRAKMLGVTYVYQEYLEKIPPYEEICKDAGVSDEEVAYMGDDLPDVPLIHRVGLGVAVANARAEVKREADFVTQAVGGSGAIREVLELIMQARGMWQGVLDSYGIE
jgi:3-deoxy-D-manno-octulosonate 8-phosphate phosphatase (KDO 8-P phosphatase)